MEPHKQLVPLKEPRVLDRETENKVDFIAFIIQQFAMTFMMSGPDAYRHLKKYGGLDYLYEFWWTLHTENPIFSVHALYEECYRNGAPR